ncbi:MAG TPA: hypothetical protein VNG69_01930 [Casimicrobiaceae bacterium]|nr:hypothetical protein [Casimicrobiaceae bacterium]
MRPRRFAEHLVYAVHHHAFAFLVILLIAVAPWSALQALLGALALLYTLLSMKRVYGGRWAGVVARAAFVGIAYGFLFATSVLALLLASVILA